MQCYQSFGFYRDNLENSRPLFWSNLIKKNKTAVCFFLISIKSEIRFSGSHKYNKSCQQWPQAHQLCLFPVIVTQMDTVVCKTETVHLRVSDGKMIYLLLEKWLLLRTECVNGSKWNVCSLLKRLKVYRSLWFSLLFTVKWFVYRSIYQITWAVFTWR